MLAAAPRASVVSLVLAAVALGQHPVGERSTSFLNPTNKGSRQLDATVYYPARSFGQNAPPLLRPGGYPTLVFLHGFNARGKDYIDLGAALAQHGYVIVMQDTATSNLELQVLDGIAMYPALERANVRTSEFLRGMFDTKRMAVGGHSTGASNTFRVLADNPGYLTGIAVAPWVGDPNYLNRHAPRVREPMLTVVGKGDRIAPWQRHALHVFGQTTSYSQIKILHLLDDRCNHSSTIAWAKSSDPITKRVFENAVRVVRSMLDHYLRGDKSAFDRVIGGDARNQEFFSDVRFEIESPQYWKAGEEKIGTPFKAVIVARPGLGIHMFAKTVVEIQTPLGLWILDPATTNLLFVGTVGTEQQLPLQIQIPNDLNLVGLFIPFQAVANGRNGLALTPGLRLGITR